jgi:diguanylate cyclase (GGDEF)-like protein
MTKPREASEKVGPTPDAHAQDSSGITSRLVLEYVERVGGRPAVDAVLARCGTSDREAWLRDESSWLPYQTKIDLFHAAAEVLDDPEVMRHIGERALEFNVGQGLTLALRALGSPRLVYQNIVRANAKFSRSHAMELMELRADFARIRFVDLIGVDFEPLDCQYNEGLLTCTPGLFGLPPAHVGHPECMGDGAPACVYEVSWSSEGDWLRVGVASGALSTAALGATVLLAPAALPVAAGVSVVAAGVSGRRALRTRRARWRALEREVRSQADVTDRLFASMQDLVSELRTDEVLAKITENAEHAVAGKQFALLLEDDGRLRCLSGTPLPEHATAAIETWAAGTGRLHGGAVLVDDCASVPELAGLAGSAGPLRSLCAGPLLYRGRRLGVLVALAPHARTFLPRDTDLVQWYASQAAIALANARFYATQEALASRDPLTGLLNHREFHQALERELERARRSDRPVSVTLVDLDGFKAVNDEHGHARGDVVLAAAGEAIDKSSRAGDLVFRVGGDEFAVLLPDTESADAVGAAERTCEAVAAIGEGVTASFGTAAWPADGGSKDVLLAEADHRLYAMKAPSARRRSYGPSR